MTIQVTCDDFLKENQRWYAIKARRKKIAIVRIEVTNGGQSDVRLDLGSSRLTAGGKEFTPEKPEVVIRKLSEFTWDFLVFAITDLLSFVALMEFFVFLCGPLYNRRLKRQLASLSVGEVSLSPGESKTLLIAFRGVKRELERLTLPYRSDQGGEECLMHDFNAMPATRMTTT